MRSGARMRYRRARWGIVVAVVVLLALAGCSTAGGSPSAARPVIALPISAPVHEPTWSDHAHALFALTDDRRIAKIDPSGRSTLSASFPDAGEDVATAGTQAAVYLPQPKLGQVAVISDADLRQAASLPAGPAPSFLTLDSGSDDLLALSEDRSTVTTVDLHSHTVLPSQHVHATPDAELDGAKRGRRIDYHLAGSGGITHHKGSPGSVQDEGAIGIPAEKTAGDLVKSSRLYVAEKGTDRLVAVDSTRGEQGLEVVGQVHLGQPGYCLGVDQTRLYAATQRTVVVLKTNSFEGYHDQAIPIVTTIDFRSALPGAARDAPLSGLAVGPDRVYLTFQGQPYVVSIAKPDI